MSSSNMMYNNWLRNKKIKMARRRIEFDPEIYPNDPWLYIGSGRNSHSPTNNRDAISNGNTLNEPGRLVGRSNNVYITTSPTTGMNELGEYGPPYTTRYITPAQNHEINNEFEKLTSDYPEEFFHEDPQHGLILHFRSSHDTLPNHNPGNTHIIEGVPESEKWSKAGLTPEQRYNVKSFIIKELADRAAHILTGNHRGGRNGITHVLQSEDIPEIHNAYSRALEQLHHEYDSLPVDARPRELGNYILHRLNHTQGHERDILTALAESLNPRPAPGTPPRPSNYYDETGPGEALDLGDLKNSLGDLLGGKNEPKIRFNSEGGFTEE